MTDTSNWSNEQTDLWIKSQYQQANQYLAGKGIDARKVVIAKSCCLVPDVAIWLLKGKSDRKYWVINGAVPADHVQAQTANSAQEVTRHFSAKWHLQAEKLMASKDKTQMQFARELVKRAESLYQLYENNQIWN